MQAGPSVAASLPNAAGAVLSARPVLPGAAKAIAALTDFVGQLATALTAVDVKAAPGEPSTAVQAAQTGSPADIPASGMPVPIPPSTPDDLVATDVVLPVATTKSNPADTGERPRAAQPNRRATSTPAEAVRAGTSAATAASMPAPPISVSQAAPTMPPPTDTPPPEPAHAAGRLRALGNDTASAVQTQHGLAEPTAVATKPSEPAPVGLSLPEPVSRADTPLPAAPSPPAALPELVAATPSPATEPLAQMSSLAAAPSQATQAVASPASQVAPALVSLAHAADGTQRLTLRLDPPELGQVHVRIDRLPDASARVEITVQRPETLTLLLRDQPQLQHALDQAGVPADGRSVTFHVAQADPGTRADGLPTFGAAAASAGQAGGDGSHAAYRHGGGAPRQDGSQLDDTDTEFEPVPSSSWLRAGIDITA